jgi:hypothetical protein
MSLSSYNENMKPSKRVQPGKMPLSLGSEPIAYHHAVSERSTTSICEHQDAISDTVAIVGQALGNLGTIGQSGQAVEEETQGRETGGRSEKVLPPPKVTAKPPLAISSSAKPSSPISQSSPKPLLKSPPPKSPLNPDSDMPVLGDSIGVHQKEGGGVVQSYPQVPFTPENDPPFDTNESKVSSPFITGNERIDRRTAFTQYCRLGEGRTYLKVANIMAVPLESIKTWAKEDNWENAYRERVTADILQVAKEENIHEVLDIRREVIAQLKQKITEAKNGKEVFKNTKEMLDTMLKLEELTGAKDAGSVRAGQIFVIIDREAWEAREAMNEKARLEETQA